MHKMLSSNTQDYHEHHTAHSMCETQKCLWLFTGVLCEENTDECNALPCLHNATCIDGIASYSCQCTEGYSGRLCEIEPFDACMSEPCHNDATCIFTGLNYRWDRDIPVYDLLQKPGFSHLISPITYIKLHGCIFLILPSLLNPFLSALFTCNHKHETWARDLMFYCRDIQTVCCRTLVLCRWLGDLKGSATTFIS